MIKWNSICKAHIPVSGKYAVTQFPHSISKKISGLSPCRDKIGYLEYIWDGKLTLFFQQPSPQYKE